MHHRSPSPETEQALTVAVLLIALALIGAGAVGYAFGTHHARTTCTQEARP